MFFFCYYFLIIIGAVSSKSLVNTISERWSQNTDINQLFKEIFYQLLQSFTDCQQIFGILNADQIPICLKKVFNEL